MSRTAHLGAVLVGLAAFIAAPHPVSAQEWLSSPTLRDGMGVDLKTVILHPSVGAEVGYDSNWFEASQRTAHSAPMLRLTPSLALDTDVYRGEGAAKPSFRLRGEGYATYREFFGALDPEQRNATGRGEATVDVLPYGDFGGTVSASYLRSVQAPFEEDLIPFFNGRRDDIGLAASARARIKRDFELEVGYRLKKKIFEESALASYSNTLHEVVANARYAFSDAMTLTADGRLGFLSFDDGVITSPELISPLYKSEPIRARAGAEYLFGHRLFTSAKVGYGTSRIDQQAAPNVHQFHSVIGDLSAKWLLFPSADDKENATLSQSAVTLAYTRDFRDNYLANFHTLDRVSVRLEYYWRGGVMLAAESGGALVQHPTAFFSDGSIRQDAFAETRLDTLIFGEVRPWDSIGINVTAKYTANLSNVVLDESQLLTPTASQSLAGMRWSRLELFAGLRFFL